jgi:hypothetical protein
MWCSGTWLSPLSSSPRRRAAEVDSDKLSGEITPSSVAAERRGREEGLLTGQAHVAIRSGSCGCRCLRRGRCYRLQSQQLGVDLDSATSHDVSVSWSSFFVPLISFSWSLVPFESGVMVGKPWSDWGLPCRRHREGAAMAQDGYEKKEKVWPRFKEILGIYGSLAEEGCWWV